MDNRISDIERLRDVREGYKLLTPQELVALIPEIARVGYTHRMIAPALIAKRLRATEETTSPTKVVPLRAKRCRTRG